MNPGQQRQLWTAYRSGELDPLEESGLIRQLEAGPAFLSDALQDAELDGLLRELGRGRHEDEERFIASVLGRLETRRLPQQSSRYPIVAPPRVLLSIDDAPSVELSGDSINEDSISQQSLMPIDRSISPHSSGTDAPDSNARIWWTLVAPLAAVTLIAITIAMTRETGRVTKKLEASHSVLGSLSANDAAEERAVETSAGETVSRRTMLAEHEKSVPAADTNSTAQSEERLPQGKVAVVDSKTDDPLGLVAADPSGSNSSDLKVGPITEGFAVLTESPSDVIWYQRPRLGHHDESLSLQRGTVEFQFASGATVKIEGPADFKIDSANSLLLARGTLSADVPERAIGFTIDTPTVQIVDLGTRFDTHVSASGTVRLHVREGKVLVKSTYHADQTLESFVVRKDEQLFVESDGTLLDWHLEIAANVFGEIKISINGESIPVESAEDLEAISHHSGFDVIRAGRNTESFLGRYVLNGRVQDYSVGDRAGAADTIAEDFAALAVIARRAEGEYGGYHVKDKKYSYSGLKDKLGARRKIARIYGPLALGGQFWSREKIETVAGDLSSLDALQRELITRLNLVDLGSSSLGKSRNRRSREFEISRPAVVHPDASSTDSDKDRFDRRQSDERNLLLRRLEGMRRRKGSVDQVEKAVPSDILPSKNQPEVDANESSLESDDAATGQQIERSDPQPAERSPSARKKRRALVRKMTSANEMVASALEAEMLGKQETRNALLDKVLRDHPNHPAANWQMGRIVLGGEWLDVTDAQARAKLSPVLAAYMRMRAANDNASANGNLTLARWCRARRPQASQMYYTRLLDDPQVTHPVIRNEAAVNLQLVSYRGVYFSRSELARREEFASRYELASHRWEPPLNRWAKSLRPQSRAEHKLRAIDEMKKVDDPDIALIASRYASYGSESFGVNVVETLERFHTPEVSLCLARYGAATMWPRVFQDSMISLRDRKMHDYVPQLLGSLVGMTQSGGKVQRSIDGTIRFEHVFRQESATKNLEKRTTRNAEARINFAPIIVGGGFGGRLRRSRDGDPRTGEGQRIERMFFTELARRNAMASNANAMAQLSNKRIYGVLSKATGQQLPDQTIAWWNWWQDYNGIEYQKASQTYFDENKFTYTSLNLGPRYQRRHSCFVAGTLVATETGMRPIEEIVAGDRVFAKHPKSGELKLQTVLVTTIRPPSPIVELRIDDETIRTTTGHPFWVTGQGWRMAKLLQEGDQLHGIHGVLNLEQIRPLVVPQPVHNLIVADFSNYFVGSSMVLVHDNTFRRPTPVVLPGL